MGRSDETANKYVIPRGRTNDPEQRGTETINKTQYDVTTSFEGFQNEEIQESGNEMVPNNLSEPYLHKINALER